MKTSAHIRNVLDALGISYDYPIAQTGAPHCEAGAGCALRGKTTLPSAGQPDAACLGQSLDLKAPTHRSSFLAGIVARIGSAPYSVALRADIDALPIREEVAAPHRSTHDGRMHACGHDAHTAMLLGAARLLKAREGDLLGAAGARGSRGAASKRSGGGVLLVFQPAEEGGGGAGHVLRSGALDGVKAIFGMHGAVNVCVHACVHVPRLVALRNGLDTSATPLRTHSVAEPPQPERHVDDTLRGHDGSQHTLHGPHCGAWRPRSHAAPGS